MSSIMLSEDSSERAPDPDFLDMKAVTKALQDCEWRAAVESVAPQVKDQFLWEELEMIKAKTADVLSGVYVLPSSNSLFEWHGVIFLRGGLFQHAAFKFIIKIPQSYPSAAPKLNFVSTCIPFHPFINPRTGLVDFHYLLMTARGSSEAEVKLMCLQETNPLGEWNQKEHRLYSLLVALKSLFYPNFNDPRIKELQGDVQVNPFQLFNPNFQSGGERAGVLKSSVQNEKAISILTKNLIWWKQNGERVREIERARGVNLFKLSTEMIAMIRLDDRPLSNEIENLLLQLQDESLNFRHHVELFVGESQDCLKYNLGSFFLRLRNDVLEVNSSHAQQLFSGDEAAATDPDNDTTYGS